MFLAEGISKIKVLSS